jgi:hypothetical protein
MLSHSTWRYIPSASCAPTQSASAASTLRAAPLPAPRAAWPAKHARPAVVGNRAAHRDDTFPDHGASVCTQPLHTIEHVSLGTGVTTMLMHSMPDLEPRSCRVVVQPNPHPSLSAPIPRHAWLRLPATTSGIPDGNHAAHCVSRTPGHARGLIWNRAAVPCPVYREPLRTDDPAYQLVRPRHQRVATPFPSTTRNW